MNIPADPFMLLSYMNMKLRDGDYESLEDLCDSLGIDAEDIIGKLKDAGLEYNETLKQFR